MRTLIASAALLIALSSSWTSSPLIPPVDAAERAGQDGVLLRWKWKKGEELVYKSTQNTVLELGAQAIHQEMGYTYSMSVTDVSQSGEATLQVKYLAVSTKGNGPQGEYDYDSEKDKDAPAEGPAAMQARMVGLSFTIKMTPAGRVTDVQGYDKLLDVIMKGLPENNPSARAQLKQMFSNDTFKGMMQQMAPPLPEEKVEPGSTWSNEFTVKMTPIGAMKFSLQSKLKDIKDDNAIIDQDIKVELKGGEKDNPAAGLLEIKDGSGKATAVYSLDKGCFLSQKSSMQMKMAVQQQEIPMKTSVELKLVSRK